MPRGAQISHEQPRDRAPPFSSSTNSAPASRINEPFCAMRNDRRLAPSSTSDDPQTPTERTETWHRDQDGVTKGSKLSVKEAIALPPNTKIILLFNKELQPTDQAAGLLSSFLGSLGADYSQFSICKGSWKNVNKTNKEHA
ncbi:hypothetical protein Ahy_B03g065723 [Arachis hypogaea]|uniref:Uncharacterized protein n=1 Tax=Arachis hypogaea TaxID=3818 RepID=A0A445A2H0_ARAHY|nr:hypothetical protein Ahy_B03g065723 [Arachis hypogaea]